MLQPMRYVWLLLLAACSDPTGPVDLTGDWFFRSEITASAPCAVQGTVSFGEQVGDSVYAMFHGASICPDTVVRQYFIRGRHAADSISLDFGGGFLHHGIVHPDTMYGITTVDSFTGTWSAWR